MVLVDFSQLVVSCLSICRDEPDLLSAARHRVWNCLRSYRTRLRKEQYGNLVLCADASHSWRKLVFPHYKANRKKDPTTAEQITNVRAALLHEATVSGPYRVVQVEEAEADDCIAVGVLVFTGERSVIVSDDKDFHQLLGPAAIYKPRKKHLITPLSAESTDYPNLHEHILYGDAVDGIPNVVSAGDTFVAGKRQCRIRPLDAAAWKTPEAFFAVATEEMRTAYVRNKQLIDFREIPAALVQRIARRFESPEFEPKTKAEFLAYLMAHGLRSQIPLIGDY